MGLKCTFGLLACLSYQGDLIPEDDVFVISAFCLEASELPARSFLLRSDQPHGYDLMDALEGLGLNFNWSPSGDFTQQQLAIFRQHEIVRACSEFNMIANTRTNWVK